MTPDYDRAEQFIATLRDDGFMTAMSEIAIAAQGLIGDSPSTKGTLYDAYSKANGIDAAIGAVVNDLGYIEDVYDHQGFDRTARINMMRLSMKDLALGAAFNSKAINYEDLAGNHKVPAGSVNQEAVNALTQLGMNSLAQVAALYVK